jgi:fucose 4-O-acetylase-like acetyltransferase
LISKALRGAVEFLKIPRVGEPPGRKIGVDALRGLSILLVVLGHAISNAENMFTVSGYNGKFYVNNFLYAFHMPLFFLISGYVLFGKHLRVRDRALRLLLPFFAWIPVYWFVNRYIRNFPWPVEFWPTLRQTVMEPGTGLWFLPTLFLCSMLLIPAMHLEKWRSWAGEVSLLVIFIGVNFIPYGKLGLAQVKYFFLYFAVGYLAAKYRSRIDRIDKERINAALLACSILFLVLFTVLYYYERINSLALPFSLKDLFQTPAAYVIRYSMAMLGIAFSIAVIKAMKTSKARTAFAWFGLVTMDIYVAHGLMLQITFGSGWLRVLVSCITGVFLSLALSFLVLRRWWVSAALFLGIRPERKQKLTGEVKELSAGGLD